MENQFKDQDQQQRFEAAYDKFIAESGCTPIDDDIKDAIYDSLISTEAKSQKVGIGNIPEDLLPLLWGRGVFNIINDPRYLFFKLLQEIAAE